MNTFSKTSRIKLNDFNVIPRLIFLLLEIKLFASNVMLAVSLDMPAYDWTYFIFDFRGAFCQ